MRRGPRSRLERERERERRERRKENKNIPPESKLSSPSTRPLFINFPSRSHRVPRAWDETRELEFLVFLLNIGRGKRRGSLFFLSFFSLSLLLLLLRRYFILFFSSSSLDKIGGNSDKVLEIIYGKRNCRVKKKIR